MGTDLVLPLARILIVDDERSNRDLLELMLEPLGFVLMTAGSGEEALKIAEEGKPDLILLDVMMPGMDGFQVVARLKANPGTTGIPVIMITALADREAKLRGLGAGAEEFLSKPVDRAELSVRVTNLLRLKAYSDFHRAHGEDLEREVALRSGELVESEKRYREIVESSMDGIVRVDADEVIVFANRTFGVMVGHEPHELVGMSAVSFVDGGSTGIARDAAQRRRRGVADTYDMMFRRRDGAQVAVSIASAPIYDIGGHYIGSLATMRDVTEQTKMIAQLTVSDRMASIGTLAAGVAHEINNPLACVMANLDMASQDVLDVAGKLGALAEFNEVKEELADAREATERIRQIVRDLKIFSRSDGEESGAVDIEKVVDSALRMAWNEIRHRARLVKTYAKTPPVQGTEARLGQVFLNLIVNAAQAIDEGRAENNEILLTTSVGPDGCVVVEIGDTGPGMSQEVLSQLFTPFFTTKPVGTGTGLGLSICHRIVTGLGGTIDVESEIGKGTSFRVSLPAASAAPSRSVARAAVVLPTTKRGKILVIDDEPMIGKAVQRALSTEHDVVPVGSAIHALERIVGGERFDVILCDLMMPQMTGMDFHAALTGATREQADRIIFLTGGAFTPRAREFLAEVPNDHLEKPFDLSLLRARLHDLIH